MAAVPVQDVSSVKVGQAISKGFDGLIGDQWMSAGVEPFDVIILSDSIYYEPNLPELWSAIDRLLRPWVPRHPCSQPSLDRPETHTFASLNRAEGQWLITTRYSC